MPLHVWLPRAHPLAPAPVSALMSGVMIKVALYVLVRVLVEWDGVLPVWFGVLVLAVGRALVGRRGGLRALPARPEAAAGAAFDRERRDHRARGRRVRSSSVPAARGPGRRSHWRRRFCTRSTTRSSRRCSSSVRARSSGRSACCAIDRLGGLLRRMPWTGAAFLVGAAAIAGLPPLNGFASEWLTLQALVHVPTVAAASATGSRRGGRARRAGRDGCAGGVLLRQGGRARPARAAADRCRRLGRGGAALVAARARLPCRGVRRPRCRPRARVRPPRRARARASHRARCTQASSSREPGSLPTLGIAAALLLGTALLAGLRGRRAAAPAPTWACGQLVEPALAWTSAGFTKPLRLALEGVLRPEREITVRSAGGVVQEISYRGHVPHLIDEWVYRPVVRVSLLAAGYARRLQSGSLAAYVAYLAALVLALLAAARLGVIG